MELNQLTIHGLQEKIKNGDVSATQITESVFSRIDAVEERVHSYIRLIKDEALAAAAKTGLRCRACWAWPRSIQRAGR
ncbi:MAG: hypothetical protein ABFD04_06470 [Syntrophomonas sp.]